MEASIVVALDNNPSRSVTDTQVQDLSSQDQLVQRVHEFWNTGRVVPPVDIPENQSQHLSNTGERGDEQKVNVISLQFLQTGIHRDSQTLRMVALEIALDLLCCSGGSVARGVLCSKDDLVPVLVLLHPLSDPGLGFFSLVVVGGIDTRG